MFNDLDETLRKLLIRDLPIRNNEVDIQFKQPNRDWSSRLNRPTLNLYLYDVRENVKLRQHSPSWMVTQRVAGVATQRRQPVRVDVYYLLTAWATDPDDEHSLLARTLMALFRNPTIPEELLLESLREQPASIQINAAQPEVLSNPADFWSSLENDIRPSIPCVITMALDPYLPITTPVVRDRALVFQNISADGDIEAPGRVLWTVRGRLQHVRLGSAVKMRVVERELDVKIESNGAFTIPGIPEGEYTLEIIRGDEDPQHHTLVVPAESYRIP